MSQQRPKPRWLLPPWDFAIWLAAFAASALLRFDGYATGVPWAVVLTAAVALGGGFVVIAGLTHLYSGRYAVGSLDESMALAAIAGVVGLAGTIVLEIMQPRPVPLSLPLASAAAATLVIVASRVCYRLLRQRQVDRGEQFRAVIVGAGEAGTQLARQMSIDSRCPYRAICFVDDSGRKKHYRVGRVRVVGDVDDLPRVIAEQRIDRILVAAPSAGAELLQRVSRVAAETGVKARALPTLAELAGREDVGASDLRDLELTDFLRRRAVETDLGAVERLLRGKRVLVTGAGGSIGSELCRQISAFKPAGLFMLDRDESALHALQISLDGRGMLQDPGLILADIRDYERLGAEFRAASPDVVFHAAALKHLTMLQRFPEEGLKTNVVGTANVLRAAQEAGADIFINISTDKAANPTSVLGETKRVAEQLTAAVAEQCGGRYLSVRFGNVLGQPWLGVDRIHRADPPRRTGHRDRSRGDALLHDRGGGGAAGAAGSGARSAADTLILDMGEPVRILDVAHQMIAMSGRSVEVEFTGCGPGRRCTRTWRPPTSGWNPPRHSLISRTWVPPLDPALVRGSASSGAV